MTSNVKEVTNVLCFVKLILRKIIKIVATRCKMHQINFGAYSAPPDLLARFKGAYF